MLRTALFVVALFTCLCASTPLIAADAEKTPDAGKTTAAKRPFMGIRVDDRDDKTGVTVNHVVHATTAHKMGI